MRVPSIETVRLIRLPFSDPRRRVPWRDVLELIHDLHRRNAVVGGHFYPPHLRGEARGALSVVEGGR
jgi:hypothetical protein